MNTITSPFRHVPKSRRALNGGTQYKFKFGNGYGASVVQGPYTYGGEDGLWELAVLGKDGDLTYETPVTEDVLGYLSESDVGEALDRIAELSAVES
jgi:hypothetical protein